MSNRAKQNSRSCVIADLGYIVPLDRAYQRKSTGRMKVNFKSGLKYFRGCIIWVAKCTSGLDNINSLVSTLCPACRRGRGTKGTPSQLAPTHPPPITHHHINPTQPRLDPPCRKVLHWGLSLSVTNGIFCSAKRLPLLPKQLLYFIPLLQKHFLFTSMAISPVSGLERCLHVYHCLCLHLLFKVSIVPPELIISLSDLLSILLHWHLCFSPLLEQCAICSIDSAYQGTIAGETSDANQHSLSSCCPVSLVSGVSP